MAAITLYQFSTWLTAYESVLKIKIIKKKNIYHPPATTNNNQPSGYQPVQGNKEILTLNHAK